MMDAIDLFCGCGGLSLGLKQAGIDVRLGVDFEPRCEWPYRHNLGAEFLCASVPELSAADLTPYWRPGALRLLAGCAPCQTFSSANTRASDSDPRWWLLLDFARIIEATRPDFVAMENVPGLARQGVYRAFCDRLRAAGYHVDGAVHNAAEYGLPQNRKRLLMLASLHGPCHLLTPLEWGAPKRTLRYAIGHLPPIEAGETCTDDAMHCAAGMREKTLARIRASKPGGNWLDLPRELRPKNLNPRFLHTWGRATWDAPSSTMTSGFIACGRGRFGHPEQDRAFSLREGAILQSFPDDFLFSPPGEKLAMEPIARMIGNAVPPLLGRVIGESILRANARREAAEGGEK